MKRIKYIVAAVLSLCLLVSFKGCSADSGGKEWKYNIISVFDDWMESFSKYSLTKNSNLHGVKTNGIDEYTGSYEAKYERFNGKEFILGGTCLERNKGSNLKATYTLEITSGKATLYWLGSGEKHTIADSNADTTYEFTLSSGDNYIVLEGDKFSGNLSLKVE